MPSPFANAKELSTKSGDAIESATSPTITKQTPQPSKPAITGTPANIIAGFKALNKATGFSHGLNFATKAAPAGKVGKSAKKMLR